MKTNQIYCGDCLEIIKDMPSESIDLIYLDPPFFSDRDYETTFKGNGETKNFKDKWDGIEHYLTFMTERIKEFHRILKSTGSIYLHCDWHASHYLKMELDRIFGYKNFRNEIIWHYRTGGVSKKWFSRKHDIIFFYSKSNKYYFNPIEIKEYYKDIYGIPDFKPGWEDRKGGKDEKGFFRHTFLPDVWAIPSVFNMSSESLGYPTQKPEVLLDRIINVSSKEGDIVLDPFCGSGTSVAVAEKLKRQWIAIEISLTACEIIKNRIKNSILPDKPKEN